MKKERNLYAFLILGFLALFLILFPLQILGSGEEEESINITYGSYWENIDEGNGSHLVRYGVSNVLTNQGYRPFNEVYNISREGRFIKLEAYDYNVTLDWGIIQKNGVWRDSQWILNTYPNAGHKLITYAKRSSLSWDFELNVSTLPQVVRENVRGFYFELESAEGINWSEVSLDTREICSKMEESNATYIGECIENTTIKDIIAKDTRISFEKEIMKGINITINKTHIIYENITNAIIDGMFTSDPEVVYQRGTGSSNATWDTRLRDGQANDGSLSTFRVHGNGIQGLVVFPYVFGGYTGAILPDATITSANLTLTVNTIAAVSLNISALMVYDPNRNGVPRADTQATWIVRQSLPSAVNWDQAGGDNVSIPDDSVVLDNSSGAISAGDTFKWNVTKSVRNWSTSYKGYVESAQGWIFDIPASNQDVFFRSSEHATSGDRPLLEISYTDPSPSNFPCWNGNYCEFREKFIIADVYGSDDTGGSGVDVVIMMKYNISAIPSGATIDEATWFGYINDPRSGLDTDTNTLIILNESWEEGISATNFDTLWDQRQNTTSPNLSSIDAHTWSSLNITTQIQACVDLALSNCTIAIKDVDSTWDGSAASVSDGSTGLIFGFDVTNLFSPKKLTIRPREIMTLTDNGGSHYITLNYTVAATGIAPTWNLNSSNTTISNTQILFSINVSDDTALESGGQYTFSTNNTGVWVNDSAINFTATPQWANVSKLLNSTTGTTIGYKWYLTDNEGLTNETDTFIILTEALVDGYWLFRAPVNVSDKTTGIGDSYACRYVNLSQSPSFFSCGNGQDVGVLWRDTTLDNDGRLIQNEERHCGAWGQFNFDEANIQAPGTITHIYCHMWTFKSLYIGFADNNTYVSGTYWNKSIGGGDGDATKSTALKLDNATLYNLHYYNQTNLNWTFDTIEDLWGASVRTDGSTATVQILSYANQRSFCIINNINGVELNDTTTLKATDTDGDGLNDYDELYVTLTDPYDNDTDDDGHDDNQEYLNGKSGYDPYDWGLRKIYYANDSLFKIYIKNESGVSDPPEEDTGSTLTRELTSGEYDSLYSYNPTTTGCLTSQLCGTNAINTIFNASGDWGVVQFNHQLNVTENISNIRIVNVFYGGLTPEVANNDLDQATAKILNNSGTNLSIPGRKGSTFSFFLKQFTSETNFSHIINGSGILKHNYFSKSNDTIGGNKQWVHVYDFAQIWVIVGETYIQTLNPTLSNPLTTKPNKNITIDFDFFEDGSELSAGVVVNSITINGSACTLVGTASYNGSSWNQTCTTPNVSNGDILLDLFINATGSLTVTADIEDSIFYQPLQIVKPTEVNNLLVSSGEKITITFEFYESGSEITSDLTTANISIEGDLCNLEDTLTHNGTLWSQNCTTPSESGGSYNLKVVANTSTSGFDDDTEIDALTYFSIYNRTIAEFISLSEIVERMVDFVKQNIQSFTMADLMIRKFDVKRKIIENFSLNSATEIVQSAIRKVVQALSLFGIMGKLFGIVRLPIESFTMTDTTNRLLLNFRSTLDSFTLTDDMGRTFNIGRRTSDSFTMTDILNRLWFGLRSTTDSFTLTDDMGRTFNIGRRTSDSFTITDILNRLFIGTRSISEKFYVGSFAIPTNGLVNWWTMDSENSNETFIFDKIGEDPGGLFENELYSDNFSSYSVGQGTTQPNWIPQYSGRVNITNNATLMIDSMEEFGGDRDIHLELNVSEVVNTSRVRTYQWTFNTTTCNQTYKDIQGISPQVSNGYFNYYDEDNFLDVEFKAVGGVGSCDAGTAQISAFKRVGGVSTALIPYTTYTLAFNTTYTANVTIVQINYTNYNYSIYLDGILQVSSTNIATDEILDGVFLLENSGTITLFDNVSISGYSPILKDGYIGEAREFDGSDDKISIDENTNFSNNWMVAMWIKKPSATDGVVGYPIGKYSTSSKRTWRTHTNNGNDFYFLVYHDKTDVANSTSSNYNNFILADTWYHIVFGWNGTDTLLYVNGTLVDYDNSIYDIAMADGDLTFGNTETSSGYWNGTIDEVLLYNRTLSTSEINQIYILTSNKRDIAINRNLNSVRFASDYFTITDQIGRIFNLVRFASDSFTIKDILNRFLLGIRSITDYFTITDQIGRIFNLVRFASDSFTLTDLLERLFLHARLTSDSFTLTDQMGRQFIATKITSDSFTLTDDLGKQYTIVRLTSDSFTITDDMGRTLNLGRRTSDSFTITDVINRFLLGIRSTTDSFTLTDDMGRTFNIGRRTSDSFTITDILNRFLLGIRSTLDSFTLTDSADGYLLAKRSISDYFTLTDLMERFLLNFRSTSDSFTLTDEMGRQFIATKRTSDSFTMTDSADGYLIARRTIADNFIMTDLLERLFLHARLTSDSFTITDQMGRQFIATKITSDSFTLTDDLGKQYTIVRLTSDSFTITDDMGRTLNLGRRTSDSFTITDVINRFLLGIRSTTESFTITDEMGRSFNIGRRTSDSFTLTDLMERFLLNFRSTSDSFTLTDEMGRQFIATKRTSDSFTMTDILDRLFLGIRSTTDSFTLTDDIGRTSFTNRGILQGLNLNTEIKKLFNSVRLTSDYFNLNSVLNRVFFGTKDISDSFTLTDDIGRQFIVTRSTSDFFTLYDLMNGTYVDIGTIFQRSVSQNFIISDTISRFLFGFRSSSESFTITDQLGREISSVRVTSQGFSLNDVMSRILFSDRSASESFIITDGADGYLIARRTIADNLIMTDVINRLLLNFRSTTDSFTLTDQMGRQFIATKITSDYFTMTDVINRFLLGLRSTSDSFTLTDSADSYLIARRTIAESFTLNDILSRKIEVTRSVNQIINFFSTLLGISTDDDPPVITLNSPANDTEDTDGSVSFVFTPVDSSNVDNCSLIYQSGIYTTSTSISEGVQNTITVIGITEGHALYNDNLQWSINCTDENGYEGSSATRYLDTQIDQGGGGTLGRVTKDPKSINLMYPNIWERESEVQIIAQVYNTKDEIYVPPLFVLNYSIAGLDKEVRIDNKSQIVWDIKVSNDAPLGEFPITLKVADERVLDEDLIIEIIEKREKIVYKDRKIWKDILIWGIILIVLFMIIFLVGWDMERRKKESLNTREF